MDRPAAIARLAALLHEKESRAAEVARLLHDDVGQTLSAAGFHLHALGGDPEAVAQIRQYLEQAFDSVRLASNKLQSNFVERSGLPLAVELLIARIREEHRLPVQLTMKAGRRFPAPVGHAVYRVIELALDNVRQHAGATLAAVRLTADEDGLTAEVQDNGCGFDAARVRAHPPGTGLVLMESYAGNANLHLRIDSAPGQGTIVSIETS